MKHFLFFLLVIFSPFVSVLHAQESTKKELRVFIADKKVLERTKSQIQAGKESTPAQYTELIRVAEKILNEKPHSVMDKDQTPPSGSKHDYMSMGKYWWPAKGVDDGTPYIRRDGEKNPEVDGITDHKYFGRTNDYIFKLSLAYYFSGDEKYAEKAVDFLRVWYLNPDTRMNPNLNFAQAVKGHNTGRGSGVLDGRSSAYMIDGLGLLDNSPVLTTEDRAGMHKWLTAYRTWLLESKNGRAEGKAKNNHGSWFDVQVLSISLYLGYTDFAKEYTSRIKTIRIESQIEPDGRQPEELVRTIALHYSYFNLEAVTTCAAIARNLGLDYYNYVSADGRSVQKAFDFLYPFTSGEKPWEYKQISKLGTETPVAALLYAYKFYGDKKYLDLAVTLDGHNLKKCFLLLYVL